MTAEVAIVNKFGVALAADSAVTVQYGKDVKIYNTLKLFSLCNASSVGVMVYQNAETMSVPWETIIKQYRKQLGLHTFPTLEEYGTNFVAYLNGNNLLFPEAVQDHLAHATVAGYFKTLAKQIDQGIKDATRNNRIATGVIRKITEDTISQWHDTLQAQQDCPSLSAGLEQKVLVKYRDDFNRLIDSVFQPLPLTETLKKRLRFIATWLLTKDLREVAQPAYSGVVIAGFGESDLYPAVTTYRIESVILNELRYFHVDNKSDRVSSNMTARVFAFAQEEVVAGFMEGIDPSFQVSIYEELEKAFKTYSDSVMKKIPGLRGKRQKEAWVADLKKVEDDLSNAFHQALQTRKYDYHVQPIVRAVSVLPKEELASMAEALVNLTSTKRRVTLDKETVGPPIDVAVISKGDGFIWIKRKHYFEADKNPQFFSRFKH